MLIPGKSHSRDESRNSRVSIETLDFARVRTFTCVIRVGSPVGVQRGRGDHRLDPASFPTDDGTPSPPAGDQHSRQWRAQNGRGGYGGVRPGKCNGLQTTGWGITASPHQTSLDNQLTSRAGWAREMAGSGRVSGAGAHLSKSRRAARRRDLIANWMPGMGDHRPAIGRGRTISRHCNGWHIGCLL